VFSLHKLLTDAKMIPDIDEQCRTAQRGCVDCKRILAESIAAAFAPIREKSLFYHEHKDEVRDILVSGAAHARSIASETLSHARRSMGIDWPSAL
jgi:tryptophanyl-tRNA synthetase